MSIIDKEFNKLKRKVHYIPLNGEYYLFLKEELKQFYNSQIQSLLKKIIGEKWEDIVGEHTGESDKWGSYSRGYDKKREEIIKIAEEKGFKI